MGSLWSGIVSTPPAVAALLAIIFASIGWLYAARRSRDLSRKQHTFNALLQASFNERYHRELTALRPYFRSGQLPDFSDPANAQLGESLSFILNHYEFIAAGVRSGDISERLLRDSERSTVIKIFEVSNKYIAGLRDMRSRQSHFEHLEWLYVRWKEKPPSKWQCFVEWVLARPLYHDRHQWIALVVAGTLIVSILVAILHLPGEMFNPPQGP
jgi:hypothetical protein